MSVDSCVAWAVPARVEARACSIPERRDASMRLNQGARFATLVGTVVLLTAACSLGALITARKMERLMETMVSNNLPSVVAAVELETALQRQRGLVDAFMLDGGQPGWLNDLDRAKPSLAHWLAGAQGAGGSEADGPHRRGAKDARDAHGGLQELRRGARTGHHPLPGGPRAGSPPRSPA